MALPKPHPPLPPVFALMFATFEACLRRGRRVDFVHVRVHAETIHANQSRANIVATDVAVRGQLPRGMALAREQRKLAAILAADVVGYSRLMGLGCWQRTTELVQRRKT